MEDSIKINRAELLEQVAALTSEVKTLKQIYYDSEMEHSNTIDEQAEELSRLREEKKELVEALREIKTELYSASGHSNTTIILRHLSNSRQLVESLLSKFEVPKE